MSEPVWGEPGTGSPCDAAGAEPSWKNSRRTMYTSCGGDRGSSSSAFNMSRASCKDRGSVPTDR